MRRIAECKYCKEEKPIAGLGLCGTCYTRFRRGNLYLEGGELKEFKYNHLFKNELFASKSPEEFMCKTGLGLEEAKRYYKKFQHLIKYSNIN